MKKEEIRKLQNHFNNGIKEGFQAKTYYSVGDRVHLKKSKSNGVVTAVIFKEDRNYPYLKIKWDSVLCESTKDLYDPFDVTKEIKPNHIIFHVEEKKRKKKVYENFYLLEKTKQTEIKEEITGCL